MEATCHSSDNPPPSRPSRPSTMSGRKRAWSYKGMSLDSAIRVRNRLKKESRDMEYAHILLMEKITTLQTRKLDILEANVDESRKIRESVKPLLAKMTELLSRMYKKFQESDANIDKIHSEINDIEIACFGNPCANSDKKLSEGNYRWNCTSIRKTSLFLLDHRCR